MYKCEKERIQYEFLGFTLCCLFVFFTKMDIRIFPIPHAFLEPGHFPIRRWHPCPVLLKLGGLCYTFDIRMWWR